MSNSTLPYIITATWEKKGPQYYNVLEITIINTTQQDVKSPKISFNISKMGQTIGSEVRAYTGFAQENYSGPVISGKLSAQFSILKAKSSRTLKFGVNFAQSTIPGSPYDFAFNDKLIVIPEDHNAPTVIEDITLATAGPLSLSLQWPESHDKETGVQYYTVKYNSIQDPKTKTVTTTHNSITLKGLAAATKYSVMVNATDYAGNTSEWSNVFHFTTSNVLKGPATWGTKCKAAPFVDTTAWPTPNIAQYSEITGVKSYFLGFIVAGTKGNETVPAWGGFSKISDGNENQEYDSDARVSNYYKQYINSVRAKGGEVIISFGGASGQPIEAKILDVATLVKMYEEVIQNYKLQYIDFDFEGEFIANIPALERHIAAITKIIQNNPNLKISYTLPVDGAMGASGQQNAGLMGFNINGEQFLQQLHDAGITPSLINVMSMEFGDGSSNNLFECVVDSVDGRRDGQTAHRGALTQIKEIYTNLDDTEIYQILGICPMFGKNLNGKVFTLEDQKRLVQYANEKKIAVLSGWDATADMDPTGSKTKISQQPGDFARILSIFDK